MRSVFVTLAIALGARIASAQQTDVVGGRVIGSDSLPLEGASEQATSYQAGVTKVATTDKRGRFTIDFISGEGGYWIDYTKVGYAPKRYEIRRIGDEEVLLADARMSPLAQALDKVQVNAQ